MITRSQSAITSGDTVFSALELAKLYSDILPLMHALPRIEAENGCAPGTLTASAGPSTRCSGADCDLSFLHGLTHIQNKVLLCKKHRVAHQCDHHCTQPDRVCPIWAYWNINRYRHEVATSWTVQVRSRSPLSPYVTARARRPRCTSFPEHALQPPCFNHRACGSAVDTAP